MQPVEKKFSFQEMKFGTYRTIVRHVASGKKYGSLENYKEGAINRETVTV